MPSYWGGGAEAEPLTWAWALLPSARAARRGTFAEWLRWTEGRIYAQPEAAWRARRDDERIVRLPDEVEFAACATWFRWAGELMAQLREAIACRPDAPLVSVHPQPPRAAARQLHSAFDALLARFYHDGLFHAAQCCGLAATPEQVYARALDTDWAACIARAYAAEPTLVDGTWRLLWATAAELLEWYTARAALRFGDGAVQACAAQSGQCCGREATPDWRELDCVNDVVAAWSLCTLHSPDAQRPRKIEPLERYVHGPLLAHWRALRDGLFHVAPVPLPQPPPLALLRAPQLDQLPLGWVWRRQVRTRRGVYFGMQDLLFYASWRDAHDNRGRHRSYQDIKKTLQRL